MRCERWIGPLLTWFTTALWLVQALGFGVVEGRPLIGLTMVFAALALFHAIGWRVFLPTAVGARVDNPGDTPDSDDDVRIIPRCPDRHTLEAFQRAKRIQAAWNRPTPTIH